MVFPEARSTELSPVFREIPRNRPDTKKFANSARFLLRCRRGDRARPGAPGRNKNLEKTRLKRVGAGRLSHVGKRPRCRGRTHAKRPRRRIVSRVSSQKN